MKSYFYNVEDDLKKYPDAWIYIVIGGRNTGKTYSSLKFCYENKKKFVFLKRTMDDVHLLCSGRGRLGSRQREYGVDLSPFKSLNRDMHWNVNAFEIEKGLGGFWEVDEDGEPEGDPIGYILALSGVSKFKGFDLSDCEIMIFDEFIPQPWERVQRKEGEQIMDLYKTISRAREHFDQTPLKVLALANATKVSNPLMNILEITDAVVQMQNVKLPEYYIAERGILIRSIIDNVAFKEKEKQSVIYKAMGNTAWGQMALENEFGYDDFSAVKKGCLKNMRCLLKLQYKNKDYYIYEGSGRWYMCRSKNTHPARTYDLNKENEQKDFYINDWIDVHLASIEGRVMFETYSMYDLIMNYKKFFTL